jgi:hypothetical protein
MNLTNARVTVEAASKPLLVRTVDPADDSEVEAAAIDAGGSRQFYVTAQSSLRIDERAENVNCLPNASVAVEAADKALLVKIINPADDSERELVEIEAGGSREFFVHVQSSLRIDEQAG